MTEVPVSARIGIMPIMRTINLEKGATSTPETAAGSPNRIAGETEGIAQAWAERDGCLYVDSA